MQNSTDPVEPTGEMLPPIRAQYLLLVRHGPRAFDLAAKREDAPLRPESYEAVGKLARWAAETLRVRPNSRDSTEPRVTRFISSDHKHCIETAKIYSEVFGPLGQGITDEEITVEATGAMATPAFWRQDGTLANSDSACAHRLHVENESVEDGSTTVLCGHQPHLSWLFNDLRERARFFRVRGVIPRPTPLPLGQSEAAFIQLHPTVQLLWAVGNSTDADKNDIRDKIRGKMETAKFVSGFVTLFLGFAATGVPAELEKSLTRSLAWTLSLLLLLCSLTFLLCALLAFDRLLMPSAFWGGARPRKLEPPSWTLCRPPSPVHWVLGSQMIHIWNRLFVPAIIALASAAGLLVFALVYRTAEDQGLDESVRNPLAILGALIALVGPIAAYHAAKPRLGYDD